MQKYKSFETERLSLLPTTLEDAAFILELVNTPKWLEYIGDRKIRTIEDSEKYIQEKILPQLERLGFSNYTVVRKSDKAKIGVCGLYDREGMEGLDIGFALLPDYEKKGYATEAVNQVIRIAFDEFGVKEIKAITNKKNLASQKLLKKAGFVSNGTMQMPNDNEELLLYVLTRVLERKEL